MIKQLKRNSKGMHKLLLLLVALTMVLSSSTMCFAMNSVTVDIPLKYVIKNASKNNKSVTTSFTLEALEDGIPMPAGSVGNTKTITMKGSGITKFGNIVYTVPDVYKYKITRKTSNGNTKYLKEDKTAFNVDVCVLSDETAHLIIKKVGEDGKSELVFEDSFNNQTKTGDSQNLLVYINVFLSALVALIFLLAIKERSIRNSRWIDESDKLN